MASSLSPPFLAAPHLPMAAAALLLGILANQCPGTEGCIHCRQEVKNLDRRFAHLCAQFKKRYNSTSCTKYPWGGQASHSLALDELSLDLLLEKTHRVFRVIELNQTLTDLPKYWDWLHEVKMMEASREALCPPACQGSAIAVNCSTCRRAEVSCWGLEACFPERTGLQKALILLSIIASSSLFLGLVTCSLEFRFRLERPTEGVPR